MFSDFLKPKNLILSIFYGVLFFLILSLYFSYQKIYVCLVISIILILFNLNYKKIIFLNLIIFSILSVFIVTGSDVFLNQNFSDIDRIFTNPTDIVGKFDNIQITIVVLFFIIVASASTNLVANYIPSQYSLINFAPSTLSLRSASYLLSFFGLLISIFWLTILLSLIYI